MLGRKQERQEQRQLRFCSELMTKAGTHFRNRDCFFCHQTLTMIDWQAMRGEEDAEVCIFRITSSYSAPADMERWFDIQGFDADIIAIPGSNLPAIVAVWLVKEQGMLFSSNIFQRFWKSLLALDTCFRDLR